MTRRALVLVAACALALTGCKAELTTSIAVDGPGRGSLEIQFDADQELAAALTANDQRLARIDEAFVEATGIHPVRTGDSNHLTWNARVPYSAMSRAGGVTGVCGVSTGASEATSVTVSFCAPSTLRKAITDAVKDEPDGDALADVMAASTALTTRVTLPGEVRQVSPSGSAQVEGRVATFTRDLSDPSWDAVRAVIVPAPPAPNPWPLRGVVVAAIAVLCWAFARRRA